MRDDPRPLELLKQEAPWFAAEVADGRANAAIAALDRILADKDNASDLVVWARRIRGLVVATTLTPVVDRRLRGRSAIRGTTPSHSICADARVVD